ncbi:hypothetical protein B0H14DRAFT_2832315 [Mycena olivaceomarginata]|nr:hypothetical protein B0H14DRAFT_2832315 [Mycena olivaceomarginata]
MSNATYKSSEPPAKRRKMSSNSSSEVSKSLNAGPNHDSTKLQLCPSSEDADIIITNVHMRKRLDGTLTGISLVALQKEKAIVTPEWLRDSVQQRAILPCGDYAALRELKQNTVQNCPDSDDDTDGGGHYTSRYACLRPCPLVCPNQGLVNQFGIIRRSRELEGKDTSALSYERTISVIKGCLPSHLAASRLAEVSKLPGIGEKMLSKISEYVNYGKIRESPRFNSLSEFTTIYGIGAATARKLFDTFGLRTIADLEEHYARHEPPPQRFSDEEQARRITTPAPLLSIRAGLALREDLNEKIPRAEVDLMHDIVMGELEKLRQGCMSTIVGGYRRGKAESNDVDIVITHPTLTNLSGFHPPDALRTSHWDTLEKALTVFILPPDAGSPRRRIHRRLDLIFAPEAYWTAITGWTGSKMFERDLRLWAKVEWCVRPSTKGILGTFPRSEQEVFEILGLEWIDPTLRNADS